MSLSVKNIEEKVILFIERYNLINTGDKVLLALSGGPDSVFALNFLHKFREKYKIDIHALHVNHQLRNSDSDEDENFCREISAELNVGFYSVKVDVKKLVKESGKSLEEAARVLRYTELQNHAESIGADKIVTAHNLSDNAETVLLNFFKGTGISGLTGIPVRRETIIRPFLCLTKEEIVYYLNERDIDYRLDKSNLESDFQRNFLRNEIVPLIKNKINPSFEEAVFRNSEILRNTKTLISRFTELLISEFVERNKEEIHLSLDVIEKYGIEAFAEVSKEVCEKYFDLQFDFNDWKKIESLTKKQTGKKLEMSDGLIILRDRDSLIFKKKEKPKENQIRKIMIGESIEINGKKLNISVTVRDKIQFDTDKNKEYISGDRVSEEFEIRKWKHGDKFIPLGMKNFKKLSDFLTEEKISAAEKENQLVLTNNNNIVWVIGLRIDDRYKILPNTKRILKLWLN